MAVDDKTFCEVWNSSKTVRAAAAQIGISASAAFGRAERLRKQGLSLKIRQPAYAADYTEGQFFYALHHTTWRGKTLIDRFWEKVDKREKGQCWLWLGNKTTTGSCQYGTLRLKVNGRGRLIRAHRFSWIIDRKRFPGELVIRHKCNTPLCVNPRHLVSGTPADNNRDMLESGRQCCGSAHHSSVLSEDDVMAIRASKESHQTLANRYGIHRRNLRSARTGRTWKHLPMPQKAGDQ